MYVLLGQCLNSFTISPIYIYITIYITVASSLLILSTGCWCCSAWTQSVTSAAAGVAWLLGCGLTTISSAQLNFHSWLVLKAHTKSQRLHRQFSHSVCTDDTNDNWYRHRSHRPYFCRSWYLVLKSVTTFPCPVFQSRPVCCLLTSDLRRS